MTTLNLVEWNSCSTNVYEVIKEAFRAFPDKFTTGTHNPDIWRNLNTADFYTTQAKTEHGDINPSIHTAIHPSIPHLI